MPYIVDLKDRRPVGNIHSVAEWEAAKQKNIRNNIFACACGSRKFHLFQDTDNIKVVCAKCQHSDIIAWNSTGAIKNLVTDKWSHPTCAIVMTEK
jgi:hypothetical protein